MVRTRVGYAGGEKENPTYRSLGDHTETLQVDYDPEVISYDDLLAVFWKNHDPTRAAWSRQYMSAVFYHDEGQKRSATESMARLAEQTGRKIHTEIAPAGTFYRAEDYHQKYLLRQDGTLMRDFSRIYPSQRDFTDSTAAARINGYLGGHRSRIKLEREIDRLGLSPAGKARLLDAVPASGS